MPCSNCSDDRCDGSVDKLRGFEDWNDLTIHTSEELIVKWVNHYNDLIKARNEQGKRYRLRQQAFAKSAMKLLDRDELELLEKQVEERI